MPAAARMGDKIKQDAPHCHAPIHPNVPVAHPPMPWTIVSACAPTVYIDNMQAAVVGSMSTPCMLPSCVPNGPGVISKGSSAVFHCNLPAARVNDMTAHAGCVGPIPSPTGKVIPPGSTKVSIGG
ncbi:PAAR domain-containing protein [Haliangium ochraceum]|uniref:PAAR repeat-containing protein n=1 Tax=Haliangium ochraceum (strain DSM 14365 / JCM 11303 / SMP-2) TaxID=502025 RepID=D0LMM8_HALO1|nr:PAAR domain-containing protein [Haliangium ochraceum]ACY18715.1 hypothetical protein Hoch_6243 [Haliangium ochraceum DSM 14365]